jgi:hypothetical protein
MIDAVPAPIFDKKTYGRIKRGRGGAFHISFFQCFDDKKVEKFTAAKKN